jgi:hypothetical protein
VAQEEEESAVNSINQFDELNHALPNPPFQTSGTIIGEGFQIIYIYINLNLAFRQGSVLYFCGGL